MRSANGDYVYRPNSGFVGIDQFQYQISDGQDGISTATVKIVVYPPLKGTGTADVLSGTATNDHIQGLGGTDQMTGLEGNDLLNGGYGNDRLNGNQGNDILLGGPGSDRFTGEDGQDRFSLYRSVTGNSGIDTLTDFVAGTDRISVSKTQFQLTQNPGTLQDKAFVLGSTATQSSHRFIYESTSGDLYFDGDGSGSAAPVKIAQLLNAPALTRTGILVTA